MRHLLLKSFALTTNLRKAFARSIASEPAVHCSDGADKNGPRWWQQHENEVLIAGIEKQQLELEKLGRWNADQSRKKRWEEIETFCYSKGINRTAEQCRQRWYRLLTAFFKIKSWENCIPPGKKSFWLMSGSDRKIEGLALNLDWNTFHAIDVIQSRKELWYSTSGFSSAGGVSSESPSSNVNSLEPENDGLERDQQPEITDFDAQQCAAEQHQPETDDSHVEADSERVQCMEVKQLLETDDFEAKECITVQNQRKTDIERHHCTKIQQQSETADFEAQQCSTVLHQPETVDSQECIEETTTSICNDQGTHALNDNSSIILSESTQQSHNPRNDARPPVLVQFINQCLVDLEGLEYDTCDPSKAQGGEGKGIDNVRLDRVIHGGKPCPAALPRTCAKVSKEPEELDAKNLKNRTQAMDSK